MEPAAVPPPDPSAPPPAAVLVVVKGRLGGKRQPLTAPLTLLGRAETCDVRLNVEGVQPLHAAIVHGPDGFALRDLAGQGGVAVNDEPVAGRRLRHGDVLTVGPFRFRLEVADPSPDQGAESEREALRIQAAAVAAQQAALAEEEMRLNQRRTTLEKQEEQLAGHLEERRRRLLELQEETKQDRDALQGERVAFEQERGKVRQEIQEARAGAAKDWEGAKQERRRLVELRKRLRRRWRRHWHEQEAAVKRREQEVEASRERLRKEKEALERERTAQTEARLRLNGDVELGKRELREQWDDLALAQQQWEVCLNQEHAERERRLLDLQGRAAGVAEAEAAWAAREHQAREVVAVLHQEIEGLEARVRNLRENLTREEIAANRGQSVFDGRVPNQAEPVVALPVPVIPAALAAFPVEATALETLAEHLADQRLHLLEQWQNLLQVHQTWQRERETALLDLDALARRLDDRERQIAERERSLDAATVEQRQVRQTLLQMRLSLEGWQARLTAREAAREGEQAALLADVQAREGSLAVEVKRLDELTRRRAQQRRKEAEELTAARTRCEDLRRQYAALWEECQQRRAGLAEEQRNLAAQTLATEQLRLELLGRAPDSAAAEKRLEKLRRRDAAQREAAGKELDAARLALSRENARLDDEARELRRQEDELAARRAEFLEEQTAWEDQRAAVEEADQRLRLDLDRLKARREQDEVELARLRDEVERVARFMMEEGEETVAPAATRAA